MVSSKGNIDDDNDYNDDSDDSNVDVDDDDNDDRNIGDDNNYVYIMPGLIMIPHASYFFFS